jgi:hypothetical protein
MSPGPTAHCEKNRRIKANKVGQAQRWQLGPQLPELVRLAYISHTFQSNQETISNTLHVFSVNVDLELLQLVH